MVQTPALKSRIFKEEALTIFRRRKIGFVFQSFNLVPVLNVYENIVLPVELDGNKIDKSFVDNVINTLGLADKIYALPSQLSGGQQQRVAIARALASKPVILLADEPTGNLDSRMGREIMDLLLGFNAEGATVVMVTHDAALAGEAKTKIMMNDGEIVSSLR